MGSEEYFLSSRNSNKILNASEVNKDDSCIQINNMHELRPYLSKLLSLPFECIFGNNLIALMKTKCNRLHNNY